MISKLIVLESYLIWVREGFKLIIIVKLYFKYININGNVDDYKIIMLVILTKLSNGIQSFPYNCNRVSIQW